MLGEQLDPVGIVGVVAEIAVGLVEDDQRRIGPQRFEELRQRRPPDDGGGRIVRRAQDHRLGPRGDLRLHVVQVRLVAGQWAGAHPRAGQRDRRRVRLERRRRHHDLVAGVEGGQRDHADELVGAVADDDLVRRHPEAAAERGAHGRGAAVGIEVDAGRLATDRLDHAGRRSQRVLVGGEADQLVETELVLERIEGFAGVVGGDALDDRTPQLSHGMRSSVCRPGGTDA